MKKHRGIRALVLVSIALMILGSLCIGVGIAKGATCDICMSARIRWTGGRLRKLWNSAGQYPELYILGG